MKDSTKELHQSLIRSAKGAITAWEKWLKDQIENEEQDSLGISLSTIEDSMAKRMADGPGLGVKDPDRGR